MDKNLSKAYKFLLVEDHLIVSQGVELILEQVFTIDRIDSVVDGKGFSNAIDTYRYDLIIFDINLPETDAYKVLTAAFEKYPQLKVLMFSMHSEELHMMRFMKLGAYGYISKNEEKEELTKAVTTILNGEKYYSKKTLILMSDELKFGSTKENPFQNLTEKESEILVYLLRGLRIKEVAVICGLNPSTVGTYKQRIFTKLDTKNIKELIDKAKMYNLV
jgi:two-component system, NarL family, invasion response regulator UvrY